MLQIESVKTGKKKARDTRKLFLHAYEKTCGNVSASCEYAGISRQTYYRWIRSPTRTNQRFRSKIENLRAKDRLVDLVESRLIQKINDGDTTAIIFVLKAKGRERGWSDVKETGKPDELNNAAEQAVRAYRLWLKDNPRAERREQMQWLGRFANCGGVSIDRLMEIIRSKNSDASQ